MQTTPLTRGLTVKNLSFRNRLVLAPITTNYGSSKGGVTQETLGFYKERSRDVGLVIVEATAVQFTGRIVPCSLGLWDDAQIPGMIKLVKTIHKQGAVAVVQLNHAGPRCIPHKGKRHGFSPSGVAFRPDVDPIVMNTDDIEQLITDFSRAAVRAEKAGFDGIEIHGAHLYLLSQFLSPLTNKRQDRYGGDARGRATLAVEIVRKVRKNLGPGYPVFFRINAEERISGGLCLGDALVIAGLLADEGVDVFDVSLIAQGGWKTVGDKTFLAGSSALPKDQSSGANVALAAAVKQQTQLPVIAVGKFGIGPAAVNAVENEKIDLIAIGRQMICDPRTARKMLDGKDTDIIACDECLTCFATIGKGVPMACKVNQNLPF
ncbi:MAG: NADH:flavin oxidoreductase [Proteobacteria bacterium]|nr:NADH:flavin oxidoreductase [Desulfobacula sp.]MBU4130413.1 NADH:flavin oxidoreductase [Pseudomonadota bacterium]